MSLDIVSRTIGGELDKKFVLKNHQCARILSIQDDWTRLRIGTRLAIEDTGANITGTPQFMMGILASPSAGLQNGPLSVATSHFVGVRQTSASMARDAGPPVAYSTAGMGTFKRVGNTNTAGTGTLSAANVPAEPTVRRWAWLIEITKGSPDFTITNLGVGANTDHDVTYEVLVQAMEAQTIADAELILDAVGIYTSQSMTVAVDEVVDGLLNAVCFAWDRSTIDLEWSDLLFAKHA